MPDTDKLQELVSYVEKHWFERAGLVTALLVMLIAEASAATMFGAPWWGLAIAILVSAVVLFVIWYLTRQPPKTPKDKLGFLVSVSCPNDSESEKLRDDFVVPLRGLIKSGASGHVFHFIEVRQHIAKSVEEDDDAQLLRIKCRAHFMLYGRVRLREINKNEHHILELEGIVSHVPVNEQISTALSREFGELLPRRLQIPRDNDLFAFQFTSEWAEIVAKYVIGLAAGISGDLTYAEKLFVDARNRLIGKDAHFPVYSKLATRIPIRISELNESRAVIAYMGWAETHSPRYLEQLGSCLERVLDSRKNLPGILALRAIYIFVAKRDVSGAITIMKKIKKEDDATWHLNVAFLFAYKGDLRRATRHYRRAALLCVSAEVIALIEDFMCWVVAQEPERYQLCYCLGFFNLEIKGDHKQAESDLTRFVEGGKPEEFATEKQMARDWLSELANG